MNPKHFYAPTPKKWRVIGDFALILLVTVQPMLDSMPVPEKAKWWIMFFTTIALVSFKFFTNTFKDAEVTK